MTYPVVTAHGVETIRPTDEHQIVVSRNQDFNEIMTLVLREDWTVRFMIACER